MEKKIYNIGKLNGILTSFFGEHLKIVKEIVELGVENGSAKIETYDCDYILTISNKAIIITSPNPLNPSVRELIVAKPLKLIKKQKDKNVEIKYYIDNENHKWLYRNDNKGKLITYIDNTNKLVHLET